MACLRRVVRQHDVMRRTGTAHGDPALAGLGLLFDLQPLRRLAGGMLVEFAVDLVEQLPAVKIADHHQRRVVGHVVPLVALGTDHAQAVRVLAPGDRLDLLAQPELRVVLAAFALADDDRSLGLGLVRLDARVVDAIGLDRQGKVDFGGGKRFEIRGAVDPGKRVQRAATA